MKTTSSWLAAIFAASTLVAGISAAAEFTSFPEATVRLGPPQPPSVVDAPAGYSAKRRTATFVVTYSGFTPAAQAAFQRAVNIWATQITSSVKIRINAQWANLGTTGILGQAGPVHFFTCSACPAGILPNLWYPIAILNKRAGADLDPSFPDINAQFNKQYTHWYFGASPTTPAGQVDFTSVVMHELGHGLGFLGSGKLVSSTQGTVRLGSGPSRRPTIFDTFTGNGPANTKLISIADPSATLKTLMTNNSLFFKIGSTRYKLFAPATFQPGSTYSHFDEATYPAHNANSLMTPRISSGETIRSPGPAMLAVFRAMGW